MSDTKTDTSAAAHASAAHQQAWAYLQAARQAGPGAPFPDALRPRTVADATAIQALGMAVLGPIGGWKVGAAGPSAPPSCAPMPASGLHRAGEDTGPVVLDGAAFTSREIESEIAFVLGHDLPARDQPYSTTEITAALASCHAGLEVLQSRFLDPDNVDALSNLADLIRHGAYVLGPAIEDWRQLDFPTLEVNQVIAGESMTRVGNPAGDMVRLVTWLANEGAVWAGGLRAGQIVTCGSWTGKLPAPPGAEVAAQFGDAPGVSLRFG
jgi:2-keto-4-pentenoate hydratase